MKLFFETYPVYSVYQVHLEFMALFTFLSALLPSLARIITADFKNIIYY